MPRRLLRAGSAFAISFTALFAIVTFTPLVKSWSSLLAGDWPAPKGDVLIVLSGDMIDEETLGVMSYWRVLYASRVYREGGFRRVVVSGKTVAPVMRDYLVFRGVPPEAITVENDSTSTRENAVFTARLLRGETGKKVLLTSDMHMLRARRAFGKAGLEVTGVPFPYGRKLGNGMARRWGLFVNLLDETAKTGYYALRGWI